MRGRNFPRRDGDGRKGWQLGMAGAERRERDRDDGDDGDGRWEMDVRRW